MIKYSPVLYKDLDSISKLFLEVYAKFLKKIFRKLPSKAFVKDIMELYLDAAGKGFIVAKDKNKVIGFVCGVKNVRELWKKALKPKRILKFFFTPRQMFIMPPSLKHFFFGGHVPLMAVNKKYRMHGIGLKLADKISLFLKKEGVKSIYFQIPRSLVEAYVKHGCKIIKKRKNWVVMRKGLS